MKILVTGAAGFIGSHVAERLVAGGHDVVGIDNFDPFYDRAAKEANLAELRHHARFRLAEADIRTLGPGPLLEGAGAVIHLAARAGVRPSIADPSGYAEVNVLGTQNLLELARKLGAGRFVFASSSSVYGVNPDVPWREDDRGLRPISPYAATKVAGELLGHVHAHLHGVRFVALRFFTVYGPRQRPDLAIHKFARRMLAGQPVPFFGDGATRRDYTYVDDIVSGVVSALDCGGGAHEVVNLGNDRTVSLREMVSALERVLGVEARLDRRPEQPGDVPQTWADISKARELLGYRPSVGFEEGLGRFAAWLRGPRAAGC